LNPEEDKETESDIEGLAASEEQGSNQYTKKKINRIPNAVGRRPSDLRKPFSGLESPVPGQRMIFEAPVAKLVQYKVRH
jgi:hypothetical protein